MDKSSILVVDDEPSNTELLEGILKYYGYEVIIASNGEEALKNISQGGIDLVLLDVMMPGIDGFEVTRRIRQNEKMRLLPIVLITALSEKKFKLQGIEAGCDDFINKPFDRQEVILRVKMLLEMNYYRSQIDEKEKFDFLLNQMEEGVLILDSHLNIKRFNQSAGRYLRLDAPDPSPDFIRHLNQYFTVLYSRDLNLDLKRKKVAFDLERKESEVFAENIVEMHCQPIKEPSGEIASIVIIMRDVSNIRKEERMKQDFLNFISHKLRTPLSISLIKIQGLKEGLYGKLNNDQQGSLNIIYESLGHLNNIINKVFDFIALFGNSHKQVVKEEIILADYIPQMLERVIGLAKDKKIDQEIFCEDKELKIFIKKAHFTLIIEHLVENAIKFCNKETICLKIEARKIGKTIQIVVSDNGPGIPSEESEKIFQKFYQIEKYFTARVEGIGLGLTMVKQLVEFNGGQIRLTASSLGGAAFIITLPVGQR